MNNSMKETLQAILDEASEKIEKSDALDKLNDVRVNFLGKKGAADRCAQGHEECGCRGTSPGGADGQRYQSQD